MPIYQKKCVNCGKQFQAQRVDAQHCSSTCRGHTRQAGGLAVVRDRQQAMSRAAAVASLPVASGSLAAAVETELTAVGMHTSATGQAALLLAAAVVDAPPAAKASLVKELRATLAQALAEGRREESPMDRLMGRMGDKLRSAGA